MPETDRCDGTQPVDIRDKTLVVLGSVGHSKPGLFRAAARRGVRLVLVKEHATWEKDYCVDVLPINCSNYENIDEVTGDVVAFAERHGADGITTTFDAAIPVLAEVAQQLHLVGVTPATAAVLRNKLLMRRRFAALGLPSAGSIHATSWPAVADAADALGYPVVVKPIMGTGSAGVVLAGDARELRSAYETARRVAVTLNGTDDLLVEEYLDGDEVCVDVVIHQGKVLFQNITDNPQIMSGPTFEGNEYITPTNLPESVALQVYDLNQRTLRGLGLTDTVSHTEIRITSRGPRLIEIHPRIAGHRMPEIVRRAVNVDLFDSVIDTALNVTPMTVRQPRGFAGYRCVCSPRTGHLREIHGVEAARRLPGISGVEVMIQPGTDVTAIPDAVQQNIAFIIAHGESYQSVRQRAEAARTVISVEIVQSNA